jgi:cytochrome oxidase Cu insertion factor (SCO1/SenC/PrrC family)
MNTSPTPPGPSSAPTRSRTQIWILICVFFAPLLLAFILYYGFEGWRPGGSTNRGELIDPARPLPEVALPEANGGELTPAELRGKWTLVYVGDGRCDDACRASLTLMRQTRLALNDEMSRVQRLFLVTGNCCDQTYLDAEHGGLITALADNPPGKTLMQVFPSGMQGQEAGHEGRIYVVDPLGNLMMTYGPELIANTPKGLLEDLKKLLKLSHIG